MVYPGRPSSHEPDPELAQWTASGHRLPEHVKAYVVREYQAGRSLSELAEITGRSHGAVRNILERAGVPRRGRGAPQVREAPRRWCSVSGPRTGSMHTRTRRRSRRRPGLLP